MSFRVPEFELEEENPVSPRKIHGSVEDDVVELLWQNGPFFRRRMADVPHSDSTGLSFLSNPCATSGVPTHSATAVAPLPSTTELYREEDEMASWLYYPLGGDDDPEGGGTIAGVSTPEQPREAAAGVFAEHGFFSPSAADRAAEADGWMTTGRPPRHPETPGKSASCLGVSQVLPASVDYTVVDSSATTTEPGRSPRRSESRVSSGDVRPGSAAMYEHGQASSSGVSCDGDEAGAAPVAARRGDERKRGARDGCDSHSEDGELESSGGKRRDSKRRASARRARAAEVHNLSERRRRDRINEKMRALQQLIPRCHKSDKASMLDDAIEYMKSLQMQVQMMSMCCSMTPVMFPGVQRYMPPMGVGMPMSMNMGMGMGMAMGMDMASGGFSHPMMPFPTAMPGHSPLAVNGGAAPMGQRVSMQAAYPRPATSLTEQVGPQPAGGLPADPVPGSTACVGAPSAVSQMLDLSAAHQARRQDPVSAAEPGISCEHTSIHDKSKLVG